jgi:hypothetical protein
VAPALSPLAARLPTSSSGSPPLTPPRRWGQGHRSSPAAPSTASPRPAPSPPVTVVEGAAAGAVATHTQGTNDVRVFGIALTTRRHGPVEIMEL